MATLPTDAARLAALEEAADALLDGLPLAALLDAVRDAVQVDVNEWAGLAALEDAHERASTMQPMHGSVSVGATLVPLMPEAASHNGETHAWREYGKTDVARQSARHSSADYATYHHFPALDATMTYGSRTTAATGQRALTVTLDDGEPMALLKPTRSRGGRGVKTYNTNAERQRAYRERQKCATCKQDGRDACPNHRE